MSPVLSPNLARKTAAKLVAKSVTSEIMRLSPIVALILPPKSVTRAPVPRSCATATTSSAAACQLRLKPHDARVRCGCGKLRAGTPAEVSRDRSRCSAPCPSTHGAHGSASLPLISPKPFPLPFRLRRHFAHRRRWAAAILDRPAAVFGPVLSPPCNLHRPLSRAGARHGFPVDLQWAPHLGRCDFGRLEAL